MDVIGLESVILFKAVGGILVSEVGYIVLFSPTLDAGLVGSDSFPGDWGDFMAFPGEVGDFRAWAREEEAGEGDFRA